MRIDERYAALLDYFRINSPNAASELDFRSPYELMVAVILSAQCTDKRVNLTTPALFKRYPDAASLSAATPEEVFPLIRSISYPNNKSKHIIGAARMLQEEFGGEMPRDVDTLMRFPGIGRKTANVIASIVYNEPVIAVDTHVFRVSRRLGLSSGKTPRAVELDLEKHIPEEERPVAHHWLILHGRYTCTAKNPRCEECGLSSICKSAPKRTEL